MKKTNAAWHGLRSFLSSKATWALLFGVVLSVVAIFAPDWTGRPELQEAFNQLALLLAGGFSALSAAGKIADGLSKGATSASAAYLDPEEPEAEEEEEE